MSAYSVSDDEEENLKSRKSKKREKTGRMTDVMKKLKSSTHETGPACQCMNQCFNIITLEERIRIIRQFNDLGDYNKQSEHLCGLISVLPIARRRSAGPNRLLAKNASFSYRVRSFVDSELQDVVVCQKAFLAIHGITSGRLQHLRQNLVLTGDAPIDKRGKHQNRPKKISDMTTNTVCQFIGSLKGRKSHYSLKDSQKIYLPEDLNIKKLHRYVDF